MIRSGHFFYDVHEALGNPKLLLGFGVIGLFFILYISFQFLYLWILLFLGLIVARTLIGRRCPRCDASLKEAGAEQKKDDVFVMIITWRCPRDGYTETEETKSKIDLFGNR